MEPPGPSQPPVPGFPGGRPLPIPYGKQTIDEDDIAEVVKVLRSTMITQGPKVAEFEEALCRTTGAGHAVAFASGTAALHAACAVAELGPGDTVATSTLSFVASANCARYVGAVPLLVDIDPATLNLDLEQIPPEATALVAVHFAGLPVDWDRLTRRPRVIIEDAAHALGAVTPDGPVGNCARSDMCCFSFHPVKSITTGEGGAVTTNDDALAAHLRRFRSHEMRPEPERGGWVYEIEEVGFNFRLTDIQAALGCTQLAKLGSFIDRRNVLADRYDEFLAGMPLVLPPAAPVGSRHARHLFPVRVASRRRVYDGLRAAGIGVQVHYRPIHQLALYLDQATPGRFPHADAAGEQLLSIPLYPRLTEAEQDLVVGLLQELVVSPTDPS